MTLRLTNDSDYCTDPTQSRFRLGVQSQCSQDFCCQFRVSQGASASSESRLAGDSEPRRDQARAFLGRPLRSGHRDGHGPVIMIGFQVCTPSQAGRAQAHWHRDSARRWESRTARPGSAAFVASGPARAAAGGGDGRPAPSYARRHCITVIATDDRHGHGARRDTSTCQPASEPPSRPGVPA